MPLPQFVLRSYGGGDQVAQLTQAIGATDTTFTITPTTGWVEEDGQPLGTIGPFTVVIDRFTPQLEKILCSSINPATGVVNVFVAGDGASGRGYDGTTAQAHVPNTSSSGVQTCWSSIEAAEANQAVFDLLGGGGASLVGVPIGTSIDFRGTPQTLPANFLAEDGTATLRATYSALFTAITIAATGTTTTAGATITGVDATLVTYIGAGRQITGVNLGAPGTVYTVQSASGTSIVLTSGVGVVAGTLGALTIYPFGAGDGSTTFNLPDSRGRVTAGWGLVGSNSQPTLHVGGVGGEQNHTLVQGELSVAIGVAAAQTATDSGHFHAADPAGVLQFVIGLGIEENSVGGPSTPNGVTFTPNTTTGTANITNSTSAVTNAGGGAAHNNMQPYSVATKCIRAL